MVCTGETEELSRLTGQSGGLVPALGGFLPTESDPSDSLEPMRNDTSATPETDLDSTHPRRGARRRRTSRKRLIIAGAIAATGLIVGTGFTVQSAISTQASIDATTALTESTGVQHEQLGAYATIAAERTRANAEDTITAANATLAAVDGKVDASGLASSVASLGEYQTLPIDEVVDLAAQTPRRGREGRASPRPSTTGCRPSRRRPRPRRSPRAEHARRRQGGRPRPRRVEVRLGRRRVPVPRQAVAEGVGLVVHGL